MQVIELKYTTAVQQGGKAQSAKTNTDKGPQTPGSRLLLYADSHTCTCLLATAAAGVGLLGLAPAHRPGAPRCGAAIPGGPKTACKGQANR